ncbi:flagellar P-ring protein precursor FlgI [Gracilimonas mengyeensis]|uniref:Flagellar P-ring protein n=2 Tax=Gracilimonas mengyeensis TaxID=1302730 RepID=A0A521FJS8_9BACT|nr:flagellar P-ring protein precursor FlgI [Gracilimonas mengyeensis]
MDMNLSIHIKMNWKLILAFLATLLFAMSVMSPVAQAQTKLSNLVELEDMQRKELIGYGLVTGLDRTGDRSMGTRGSAFTVQSVANMLENFGITVDAERLRTRNVAAVMVTASISPYHAPGSVIDVTVSSLGDARSLQGGVLLQTPMFDPDNEEVFVKAQGPLIVGGATAEITGARVSQNQTLTATIPGGGIVEKNEEFEMDTQKPLGLVLRDPNFTNARNIVETINQTFDEELASMHHSGLVRVEWPEAFQDRGNMNVFTSIILDQEIVVETPARVVINERTGTIVAGGDVIIDDAMISHGNLQLRTQISPYVSQPPAFSGGETQVLDVPEAELSEELAQTFVLEPQTTVQQLSASLNALGMTPRDIISIFQALDKSGVLRAKLIVM